MKAVFLFKEERVTIEVPLWLHHISQLSNRLATLTIDSMMEDFFNGIVDEGEDVETEAYEFMQLEFARIFAENQNISSENLFIEFYQPDPDVKEEQEFGVIVGVKTFEEIEEEYKTSINSNIES